MLNVGGGRFNVGIGGGGGKNYAFDLKSYWLYDATVDFIVLLSS